MQRGREIMVSVSEPIMGPGGGAPSGVQGHAEPMVRGAKFFETESFWSHRHPKRGKILQIVQ